MKTRNLIVGLAVLSLCQTGWSFQDAATAKQRDVDRINEIVKQNKVTVRSKSREEIEQTVKELKALEAETKMPEVWSFDYNITQMMFIDGCNLTVDYN